MDILLRLRSPDPYTLYLEDKKDLPKRNFAIMEALKDGYTQGEVGRYLGVSTALSSHIFRSFDD